MADGQYMGLLDMINGGGAGRAGDTFEGGPLSGLLNLLGIKPRGFYDRQEEQQLTPIPMIPMPAATTPMLPPPNPYAPGAITTTTLPPVGQMPVGQMSDEALVQLIRRAVGQAPLTTGYGPR